MVAEIISARVLEIRQMIYTEIQQLNDAGKLTGEFSSLGEEHNCKGLFRFRKNLWKFQFSGERQIH